MRVGTPQTVCQTVSRKSVKFSTRINHAVSVRKYWFYVFSVYFFPFLLYAVSRYPAAGHGSFKTKCPAVPNFQRNSIFVQICQATEKSIKFL